MRKADNADIRQKTEAFLFARSVDRNGGTLTRSVSDRKRFMNMFVPDAVSPLPPMETAAENTVPTNAMWRQGSKAVKPMTKEQITAEIKYQASIAPFRLMLKSGQISTEDYRVIDTILTEKYLPVFVQFIPPN